METLPTVTLITIYTRESGNFLRICGLLLDLGTRVLRGKFDTLVPARQLFNFLSSNKALLKKIPTIGGHGRTKLFPKNGNPCSEDFDISLLYILLRQTRFTDPNSGTRPIIDPPQNGWGELPDSSDTSDGANIERLRQARNDLYGHTLRTAIANDVFGKIWTELSSVIIGLGGRKLEEEIDNLRFAPLDNDNNFQDLKTILDKQSKLKRVMIKSRGEDDKKFVETRAYQQIEREMARSGAVLIIGDPGEGKTSCAWHLILKRLLLGDELIIVNSSEEWVEKWDPSKKQIVFVDDCLGQSHAIPERAEAWQRLQENLRGCINSKDTSVIATVRRYIYRDLHDTVNRLHIFGKAIDITSPDHRLSSLEKLQMIRNHLREKDITMDADTIDVVTSCYTPSFPLSCRQFASDDRIREKGAIYFLNPVSQLREQLVDMSKKDNVAFSALVLLLVCDENLQFDSLASYEPAPAKPPSGLLERLRYICCSSSPKVPRVVEMLESIKRTRKLPNVTLLDIHRAIEKLRDSYVTSTDTAYKFVHESYLEAVGVVLACEDAVFVLQNCSAHFIQQHVRIQSFPDTAEDTIVRLPEIYYKELAKRLTDDVTNGDIDTVFQNPSINDLSFSGCWCYYISCMNRSQQLKFYRSVDKKGYTLLYWVGRSGNLSMLRYFLQFEEPTLDCLHGACYSGNVEAVKVVLSRDVDMNSPDAGGLTPVLIACHTGNFHILSLLLKHGANVNQEQEFFGTPLHYACWNEDTQLVRLLLDNGAKSNVVTDAGWPGIYFSGSDENVKILQMILKRQQTITVTANVGWSPLHLASGKGNMVIVRYLIENGADLNLTTNKGWSPLLCATRKGRHAIAKLLVQHGADYNQSDYFGVSCLHRVCYDGHDMVANVLIQEGADVNIRSKVGYTPLHCACDSGHASLVKLLLQNGADVDAEGLNKKKPIHIARMKHRNEIIEILECKKGEMT